AGQEIPPPFAAGRAWWKDRVHRRAPRQRREQREGRGQEAGEGEGHRRNRAPREGRQDRRLQDEAPEELREKAGTSAGLHGSEDQRHQSRLGGAVMAHKKSVGSSRNGRDSNPKYQGVKKFGGEKVIA